MFYQPFINSSLSGKIATLVGNAACNVMEELLFLFVVVLLILFVVLLSRVGKVREEVGIVKDEVREALALIRARERRDRSHEMREAAAKESQADEPVAVAIPEPEPVDTPDLSVPEEGEEDPEKAEEIEYAGAAPPPLPAGKIGQEAARESNPPIPTPQAAEPSKFETAAREILGKIWNWIVVGEEHRPKGVTMEYAVATTWLLRIGVLILVIGIGFFLKYSITEGIIGPIGKVALAALGGVGLLAGGLKLFSGRYDLLGQGLAGAGFATLYFTFFTAQNEGLLGAVPTFLLMILVTIAAGFLAVRFQSQLVAILGLLGGYLTPIMITSAQPGLTILFSYLLLLGLGVFFIAARREWRLLHYLSFGATWIHVANAIDKGFTPERFWTFLPFLIAFFLLFSTVTFIYHLVHKKKSTVLELLFLFLNAGVFFGFTVYLMDRTYPREAVAIVTVGLALFYIAHIYLFMKRQVLDRGLLMSFLGLASLFVAITLPLILSKGWITVSWSVQAFVMLWIASKMKSEFLRQLAYVLYLIVLARFAIFDLHSQYSAISDTSPPGEYWMMFLERLMVLGLPIGSFFAAGYLFSKEDKAEGNWIVPEENDIRPWFGQSMLSRCCFWIVVLLGFVYFNLEANHTIGYLFDPLTTPVHTLIGIGLAAILFREMMANRETIATALFWVVSAALLLKVFVFDFVSFRPGYDLAFYQRDFTEGFLMRLLDYGAVIAFFIVAWLLLSRREGRDRAASAFGYVALAGIFLYSSLEVWTGLTRFLPEFKMGGISIFWSLFSFTLLFTGISKNVAILRRIGLVLMTIVVGKIFFVDLSGLEQLYRIVAFIALGIIVLICSFLYLKYRHRFTTDDEETNADS